MPRATRTIERRRFTATGHRSRRYLLDGVPVGLWNAAAERAKREHRSMRNLLLALLDDYGQGRVTPTPWEPAAGGATEAEPLLPL